MDDSRAAAGADPTAVQQLLAYIDQVGLQPVATSRGWTHMGAVICDAGLQAGINYTSVVLPRLRQLVDLWPNATTTSAFIAQVDSDDLGAVLRWRGEKKLAVITGIANVLATAGIETTAQLAGAYAEDHAAAALATSLRRVKGVGSKTVDYLAILVGSNAHVAIDQHLRAFARDAGITDLTYEGLRALYAAVATHRGWTLGDLDSTIWRYGRRHE